MRWDEIVRKFKDEWVLVEAKTVDENFILKEGKVITHSKDKSSIYEQLLKWKGKNIYRIHRQDTKGPCSGALI